MNFGALVMIKYILIMDDKQLTELLKYSSPKELYIVSWNHLLKVLFCPFEVITIEGVGELRKGEKVLVYEVKVTRQLQTVYIIRDIPYYYYHFDIII